MAKTYFQHPDGSVYFSRNPELPADTDTSYLQSDERSTGGEKTGVDYAAMERVTALRFRMSQGELDNLQTFMDTVVFGTSKRFAWYDCDGSNRTVRFASPELDYTEIAYDTFDVTIKLMEERKR